jgi:hypothetical protein
VTIATFSTELCARLGVTMQCFPSKIVSPCPT